MLILIYESYIALRLLIIQLLLTTLSSTVNSMQATLARQQYITDQAI